MKLAVAIFALFAAVSAQAQQQLKPPPRPDDSRPTLTAQDGKEARPLTLSKADVRVVITGFMAQTTMTLTFHNDLSRVLEGELTFPLPQGATVSGYGLDVNGTMVDGVPVEKQQARVAFETEVRKGVDPGLVEQVKGNNFRTRIYPIPARGDRTIKVQYVSDLNATSDDVTYLLPTNWGEEPVGEFHLQVEVVHSGGEPTFKSTPAQLSFAKQGNHTIADKTFKNIRLSKDLVISLPNPPSQSSIVEKRPASEGEAGALDQYYFVINDLPHPPAAKAGRVALRRIAIAWDASLSRAETDKSRELDLLKSFFQQSGDVGVDVFVFRNSVEEPVSFYIQNGDATPLLKHLSSLTYDGGTNLSALRFERNLTQLVQKAWKDTPADYNFWLLFSDGLADLYGEKPKSVEVPVYAISNDSRSNHQLLAHLAESSGGQYFNLSRVSNEQVLPKLGQTPFALLRAEYDPKQVGELYPGGVVPVMGRVALAGRLLSPEATITLHYGYGTTEVASVNYTLRQSDAAQSGLAARFWAQQKTAQLSQDARKNKDELLALGREFNLVTPSTSLMVLETLAQYLQYSITPPKSRPEIYNAYMAQVAQHNAARKQAETQKLEQVLAMWNARVQWWEKKHDYAGDFRYVAPPEAERRFIGVRRAGGGVPATQPRAALPEAGQREQAEEIVEQRALAVAGTRAALSDTAHVSNASGRPLQQAAEQLREGDADGIDAAPMLERAAAKKMASGRGGSRGPVISLKPWDPETPYLVALRKAPGEKAYSVYLEQRSKFGSSPAFFLDCADFFLQKNDRPTAIRILTNIAELRLENAPLLRVAAHRLMQINEHDLGIDLFENVLRIRPEEPQSYRDLALALEERALADPKSPMAQADLRRAAKLLEKVVMGSWDGRFPEIEVIALEELNDLLAKATTVASDKPIIADLDPRLLKLLDLDVRIVMTWDADQTDIDLWVTEPSGEKCMYNHNRTTIGGLISHDFTQGYGPEEYCLRNAMKGEYKIQANFYGSRQQALTGPTTIQATVITHYGRPDEKRQSLTVRLTTQKEVVDLGTVKVD